MTLFLRFLSAVICSVFFVPQATRLIVFMFAFSAAGAVAGVFLEGRCSGRRDTENGPPAEQDTNVVYSSDVRPLGPPASLSVRLSWLYRRSATS